MFLEVFHFHFKRLKHFLILCKKLEEGWKIKLKPEDEKKSQLHHNADRQTVNFCNHKQIKITKKTLSHIVCYPVDNMLPDVKCEQLN